MIIRLAKETITKDDGRYLIYYTFVEAEDQSDQSDQSDRSDSTDPAPENS